MKHTLRKDVVTKWGTFARGLDVQVVERTDTKFRIVLSDIVILRLTTWVPQSAVSAVPA